MPEAQRWKDVPEMQFHWPSVLQLPVKAPELELEVDPGLEGEEVVTGAGAAAEVDAGSGSTGALDGVASGTGAVDAEAAVPEALSVGAEEEVELEEPEGPISPEPPKVAVPVQALEPSLARLADSPSYSI